MKTNQITDKNGLPPTKPMEEIDFPKLLDNIDKTKNTDPTLQALKSDYVKSGDYLKSSVHWMDTDYVPSVRNNLVTEFNATTTSELLLVDIVANAYFSYMRSSRALKSFIEDNDGRREYESQTWINMMKELSKVVEMTNRHFITTLTCLKEYRQPAVKIRVNAKQAFVSQNQQFNKNA